MECIESPHNRTFKHLHRLAIDNHYRRKNGLLIVEGKKEIDSALAHGYPIELLCFDQKHLNNNEQKNYAYIPSITLHHQLFSKLVYRENSSSVIGIFKEPDLSLTNINLSPQPLIVIIEGIEKPGNVGAILRSCDAVKADAVIVSGKNHSFFHPNTIRSSVGTLFSMQLAAGDEEEILQWCKLHHIKIYSAALQTNTQYTQVDYTGGTAFVMGAEDKGLEEFWRKSSNHIIKIPMLGHNDSLNVSVSAAVLLYEAIRQRS